MSSFCHLLTAEHEQTATRQSLWDSGSLDELKETYINPQWENLEAFDSEFRWTHREEREVRRVVDWKVMVCHLFQQHQFSQEANRDVIDMDLRHVCCAQHR